MPKLINLRTKTLEKAIQKAIDGGWDGIDADGYHYTNRTHEPSDAAIIFNHDFAKALWGDGKEAGETVMDGQEYEIKTSKGVKAT